MQLCVSLIFFVFFFSSRRRHTRFDCDWSSDVCSSDLSCGRIKRENPIKEEVGGGTALQSEAPQEKHLRWDLDRELYPGPKSAELEADIARLRQMIQEFHDRYVGKINLPSLEAEFFATALTELEEIDKRRYNIDLYAYLLFFLDTRSEEASALMTRNTELGVEIERLVLPFQLEWRRLPAKQASDLLTRP